MMMITDIGKDIYFSLDPDRYLAPKRKTATLNIKHIKALRIDIFEKPNKEKLVETLKTCVTRFIRDKVEAAALKTIAMPVNTSCFLLDKKIIEKFTKVKAIDVLITMRPKYSKAEVIL